MLSITRVALSERSVMMLLLFGLVVAVSCQHAVEGTFILTLSGVLEVERLEPPGERRRVDNVHAVLAVISPVQHDSHHKDCNRDYAGSKARVQSHVVGAVHT